MPERTLTGINKEKGVHGGGRAPPFLSANLPPVLFPSAVMRLTVTVRSDAGVLIAVDRSSKQRSYDAESSELSLWVKDQGFTQATLVDNPLSALKARLCNLGC